MRAGRAQREVGSLEVAPETASGPSADGSRGNLRVVRALTGATADLAETGLGIIYEALDDLVARYSLADAAVVVEVPGLGRQVFRAGRRPIALGDDSLLDAEPGCYTQPAVDDPGFDRSLLLSLCTLALRTDALRYESGHDPLTGLHDRRCFDRLLDSAIARSLRYGWAFTLVLVDLDDLKAINDGRGHLAGDEALRVLGERFGRALRFGDDAARIGGDEFAVILPGADPGLVPGLLARIGDAGDDDRACPSFSYGIASCPADGSTRDDLIRIADERLYAAKAHR